MPTKETTPTNSRTSAVRTFGPAIPLAIALAHTALTGAAKITTTTTTTTIRHVPATTKSCQLSSSSTTPCKAPFPLLSKDHPVDWWFVFKLNATAFPKCPGGVDTRSCPFGGTVQTASTYRFGQQYVYASKDSPTLQEGVKDCIGTTLDDPVGATFDEVYNGNFHYVIWNDQPYGDPEIDSCKDSCPSSWGHSKGMLAWNDDGDGFVMQVSTPSWPEAGNKDHPRETDGNTLGCVNNNDVKFSQHFFALRLEKDDVVEVLKGLANASVATDPSNAQIVNNGGPSDVQALVTALGKRSDSASLLSHTLSSGVLFIAKPTNLNVPPWQMVSATLDGVPLRTATWWNSTSIPSTNADTPIECWEDTLGKPGAVEIATTGSWKDQKFSLTSGGNHAKIGVSTSISDHYAIFGDMNQQGAINRADGCKSSQNGRGGMFFVMDNAPLSASLGKLIEGDSAPATK